MRVLVAPLGPGGHLLPLPPFAQTLRAAGHAVAFAPPPAAEPPLREAGFPTFPEPTFEPIDAAAQRLGVDSAALSPRERDRFVLRVVLMGTHLELRAGALLALAREWAPDAVVGGHGHDPGAVAADRLGVPHACVQVAAGGLLPSRARTVSGRPGAAGGRRAAASAARPAECAPGRHPPPRHQPPPRPRPNGRSPRHVPVTSAVYRGCPHPRGPTVRYVVATDWRPLYRRRPPMSRGAWGGYRPTVAAGCYRTATEP